MTNRQIIINAIEKAEKVGWEFAKFYNENVLGLATEYKKQLDIIERHPELLIFNHDWAIAFGKYIYDSGQSYKLYGGHDIEKDHTYTAVKYYIANELLSELAKSIKRLKFIEIFLED